MEDFYGKNFWKIEKKNFEIPLKSERSELSAAGLAPAAESGVSASFSLKNKVKIWENLGSTYSSICVQQLSAGLCRELSKRNLVEVKKWSKNKNECCQVFSLK